MEGEIRYFDWLLSFENGNESVKCKDSWKGLCEVWKCNSTSESDICLAMKKIEQHLLKTWVEHLPDRVTELKTKFTIYDHEIQLSADNLPSEILETSREVFQVLAQCDATTQKNEDRVNYDCQTKLLKNCYVLVEKYQRLCLCYISDQRELIMRERGKALSHLECIRRLAYKRAEKIERILSELGITNVGDHKTEVQLAFQHLNDVLEDQREVYQITEAQNILEYNLYILCNNLLEASKKKAQSRLQNLSLRVRNFEDMVTKKHAPCEMLEELSVLKDKLAKCTTSVCKNFEQIENECENIDTCMTIFQNLEGSAKEWAKKNKISKSVDDDFSYRARYSALLLRSEEVNRKLKLLTITPENFTELFDTIRKCHTGLVNAAQIIESCPPLSARLSLFSPQRALDHCEELVFEAEMKLPIAEKLFQMQKQYHHLMERFEILKFTSVYENDPSFTAAFGILNTCMDRLSKDVQNFECPANIDASIEQAILLASEAEQLRYKKSPAGFLAGGTLMKGIQYLNVLPKQHNELMAEATKFGYLADPLVHAALTKSADGLDGLASVLKLKFPHENTIYAAMRSAKKGVEGAKQILEVKKHSFGWHRAELTRYRKGIKTALHNKSHKRGQISLFGEGAGFVSSFF